METIDRNSHAPSRLERRAITVQEAAEMLAVTPLTIRRAIKDGKIKAMQINANGRYRISVEDLDAFIRKNTR